MNGMSKPSVWYFEDEQAAFNSFRGSVSSLPFSVQLEMEECVASLEEFERALLIGKQKPSRSQAIVIDLNLHSAWPDDDRQRFMAAQSKFLAGFISDFTRETDKVELTRISTGFLLASLFLENKWPVAVRTQYSGHGDSAIGQKLAELKASGAMVVGKDDNSKLVEWLKSNLQPFRCVQLSALQWLKLRTIFGSNTAAVNPWHMQGGHKPTMPVTTATAVWNGTGSWAGVVAEEQKLLLTEFGYPSSEDKGVLSGRDSWRFPPLRVLLQYDVADDDVGARGTDLSAAIAAWSNGLSSTDTTAVRVSLNQSVKGHDYWWFNVSALLDGLDVLRMSDSGDLRCYIEFSEVQFEEAECTPMAPNSQLSGGLLIRIEQWLPEIVTSQRPELVFNAHMIQDVSSNGHDKAMYRFLEQMRRAGVCWIAHGGRHKVKEVIGRQECAILSPIPDDNQPFFEPYKAFADLQAAKHLVTGGLLMFIAAKLIENPFNAGRHAWVVADPVQAAIPAMEHFGLVKRQ